MAWTSPATYASGDVLTAANLNTYLRDNLSYLKASPVFDGSPAIGATSNPQALQVYGNASGAALGPVTITNTSAGTVGVALTMDATGASGGRQFSFLSTASGAAVAGAFAVYDSTGGAYRMTIDQNGLVGIGTQAPAGRLHSAGNGSANMLHFDHAAVGGTAVSIATGVTILLVAGVVICSAGANPNGSTAGATWVQLVRGQNSNIDVNTAADRFQIQLSAGGALSVQRTVGSNTFKASLLFMWL